MSQNDYVIDNQSAPDFRSDLNGALQALASLSSGGTAPSTTYANMLWYDTTNNILKMRTEADDAWINVGTLNQSTNKFEVAGVLDEDDMASDSATFPPSQQSVKAYVDAASPITVIEETDLSNAATHDIVLDTTTYDWFQIVLSHMRPDASVGVLVAQVSTDGGSTFKSGASDYAWQRIRHVYYSADVSNGDPSDSSIQVCEVVGGDTGEAGLSGIITLIHPQNASRKTSMRFQGEIEAADGSFQTVESGGRYNTAGAVDAIRLKFASNNIASGKIIVYGYKGV